MSSVFGKKREEKEDEEEVGYNRLINGVYSGYNPLTSHLLTSLNIQVETFWYFFGWYAHVSWWFVDAGDERDWRV